MSDKQIIFLDLETTGLGPQAQILEIAMVAVEIKENRLHETDVFQCVIQRDPDELWWQPRALEMHTENGLLDALPQSRCNTMSVVSDAYTWCRNLRGFAKTLVMAGNSIHTDRTWLQQDPDFEPLEALFSHRMLDVSAFQSLAEAAGLPVPEKRMAHRALDDCRESIQLAQCWLDVLSGGFYFGADTAWWS